MIVTHRLPGAIIAALITLLIVSCNKSVTPVMVSKGVLDLRHIEQGDEFSVKMNGEWEFYFNKFLASSPSRGSDSLKPDCYSTEPDFWSD
mgnify:FL=1